MIEIPDEVSKLDVLLLGVAGSTAFGLNHPHSDIDLHGTYVAPLSDVLGINGVQDNYSHRSPDVQMHELGKFVSLGLKSNPNVLENLWLSDYPILDEYGQALIDFRKKLLSEKYVRNAYSGYAKSQLATKVSRDRP